LNDSAETEARSSLVDSAETDDCSLNAESQARSSLVDSAETECY